MSRRNDSSGGWIIFMVVAGIWLGNSSSEDKVEKHYNKPKVVQEASAAKAEPVSIQPAEMSIQPEGGLPFVEVVEPDVLFEDAFSEVSDPFE